MKTYSINDVIGWPLKACVARAVILTQQLGASVALQQATCSSTRHHPPMWHILQSGPHLVFQENQQGHCLGGLVFGRWSPLKQAAGGGGGQVSCHLSCAIGLVMQPDLFVISRQDHANITITWTRFKLLPLFFTDLNVFGSGYLKEGLLPHKLP